MSVRASAARYARALLDVTVAEKGNPEQIDQELSTFASLLAGNPELRGVLTNPAIPASAKVKVTRELLSRLNPSPVLGKMLMMLAERDRLVLLPDLVSVYRDRLMDYQQVVRAEVTTAAPMPQDRAEKLQQRLAAVTGRRVMMTTKVDPALIGGVIARIGSTVYDGSVVTQLETMKQRLLEQN
jgi:F-type H+-transporting ATPase subunit delta